MSKSLSDNLKALMHALAASAEAFLHHTFGERYTAVMFNALILAATVSLLAPLLAPETPARLMPLFTTTYFVRLLAHLVAVWRRRRAGVHVQSTSSGISWGVWSELRLPAGVIHGLVEPLLCLAAAWLLSHVDQVLSIWLLFAALALMLKTMIHTREGHQQMLDTLDDRMSARNRHATVQQQTNPRPQIPDVPVTVNAPVTPPHARALPGLFRNLDPALQQLMQQNSAGTRPVGPQRVRPANPRPPQVNPTVGATPPPTTSSATPRVALIRTRPAPAPVAPLYVRPASALSEVRNPSEVAPIRSRAEVRKPHGTATSSPLSAMTTAESRTSERGNEERQRLRERIREEAMGMGFIVGRGSVTSKSDLILTKDSVSLAVWIALDTTAAQELEDVKRCLEAGAARVAIVSPKPERLKVFAEAMHAGLPLAKAMKVGYYSPEEFVQELNRLAQVGKSARRRKRTRSAGAEKAPL